MNTRFRSTKLLVTLSLIALVVSAAVWSEVRVKAVGPPRDNHIAFGLVHITAGQSIQLNLSRVDPTDDTTPPPDDGIPPPDDTQPPPDDTMLVPVRLMIFDSDGVMVTHSMEQLAAGHSASLMLNRDSLDRAEDRVGLRAVATVGGPIPGDDQPISDDSVVASFEIVDNATRRTVFAAPVVSKGFNPQPEPPASRQ